ncbi:hypothetical protein EBR57_07225 [bacterium]|nr:hypothetical protein [bacterium]
MKRLIALAPYGTTFESKHPLFFSALNRLFETDFWEDCLVTKIPESAVKSMILNPNNWLECPPPLAIGSIVGSFDQRELTPDQLQHILASANVTAEPETQPQIDTRHSDGMFGRHAPYWHIDFDPSNLPRFDILTVAFSESAFGGTVYLSLPRFNTDCINQYIKTDAAHESNPILESIQHILEELLRVDADSDWLKTYIHHTIPNEIYKNITQDYFHKSPDLMYPRVLFIVGIPKPYAG